MKVKIVGSICIIFLCMISALYAKDLTVRVTTLDGDELKHVGMGQAFMLEVCVDGIQKDKNSGSLFPARGKAPIIKGLEKFTVRTTGSHMQMVNGVGSIRYRYKVIIDQPGGYHIGPALLELGGKQLVSDKIEVTVADQPVLKHGYKKHEPVLLAASTNKQRVMLGESFTYTLRYYFQDRLTRLQSITPPEFTGFTVTKPRGPVEGREVINGVPYFYGQWEWDITPHAKGEQTIQPATASVISEQSSMGSISALAVFFGGGLDSKHIFSNSIKVSIDPLPAYSEPVQAIGQFSQFKARVNPAVVKQGEGLVLTLEVEGNGNIEQLSFPELQHMPESLKFYDSKHYMVEGTRGPLLKKKFEYIVQGIDAGMYEIPVQTFTYFDPADRTYKKLQTVPLSLKVRETTGRAKQENTRLSQKQLQENQRLAHHILPRTESGAIHAQQQWYVSFNVLLLLLIMMVCGSGIAIVGKYIRNAHVHKKVPAASRCFTRMREELKRIEQEQNYHKLPAIIQAIFAERYAVDRTSVTQDFMLHALAMRGVEHHELLSFEDFYNRLIALTYGKNSGYYAENASEYIAQTYAWISFLEKKLC